MKAPKNMEALTQETARLEHALADVKGKRTAALLKLARGDKSQRQVISTLEAQERDAVLALEVHQVRLEEAETAAISAQAAQTVAQAARRAEMERAIRNKEMEECTAICASLSARKQRLGDMAAALQQEMGQLQLDEIRLRSSGYNGPGKAELSDLLFRLPVHLIELMRVRGLRPLMAPGYGGTATLWPLFSAAGLNLPSGIGPLTGPNVEQAQRAKRHAAWAEEL